MKTVEIFIIAMLATMSLLGVYLNIYNVYVGWFILGSTGVAAYLIRYWLKRNIR
jgi:hypothetical protein